MCRRGDHEYVCIRAMHLLVSRAQVLPFHKSLRPSKAVADIMVNTTIARCPSNGSRSPMDFHHPTELTGRKAWELSGRSPMLGVHVRRTDMLHLLGLQNRTAPSLAEYVKAIKEKLHEAQIANEFNQTERCLAVYVATDDDVAEKEIRSSFPEGKDESTHNTPSSLHHCSPANNRSR